MISQDLVSLVADHVSEALRYPFTEVAVDSSLHVHRCPGSGGSGLLTQLGDSQIGNGFQEHLHGKHEGNPSYRLIALS